MFYIVFPLLSCLSIQECIHIHSLLCYMIKKNLFIFQLSHSYSWKFLKDFLHFPTAGSVQAGSRVVHIKHYSGSVNCMLHVSSLYSVKAVRLKQNNPSLNLAIKTVSFQTDVSKFTVIPEVNIISSTSVCLQIRKINSHSFLLRSSLCQAI